MFKPQFKISSSILNKISEITEIKSIVDRSQLLPEREVFLRRIAVINMAHSSTSIEGNTLKQYQVEQIAMGKEINAEKDQILEVKNYLTALALVDKLSANKTDFTSKDILSIHKTVTNGLVEKEKCGSYRKTQVYIVNVLPNGDDEVVYTPPSAKVVESQLDQLLEWMKKEEDLHPIIKAGLLHYEFESIHPFTDGNGRTGRLLTLLYLYRSGWDFKKVLVLEDFYNQNRKRYYESLQTGATYKEREHVDLTNWLEYYTEGFLEEVQRVNDQMTGLMALGNVTTERKFLEKNELQIVDFVVTLGKITSADVVDILQVPKRTAQDKLKKLEDIRVLKKMGAGPSTYYVVNGEK